MFVVRNIFHAKSGKAKELVAIFKKAAPIIESTNVTRNTRIMTDAVSTFSTVVVESEVEDLNTYMDMAKIVSKKPELGEIMKGYMDLIDSGHREIFRIE